MVRGIEKNFMKSAESPNILQRLRENGMNLRVNHLCSRENGRNLREKLLDSRENDSLLSQVPNFCRSVLLTQFPMEKNHKLNVFYHTSIRYNRFVHYQKYTLYE